MENPPPFNYYKYMGSMTSPPCEEYVVHFVVADKIKASTTVISEIREGLEYPEDSDIPKDLRIIIDGSNRHVQPLNKREVMFYDREKGCTPYEPNKS